MSVLFTAQKSNLKSKDGKKKWHPRLVKIGKPVTTYELAVEISKRSSLSPGDVLNVIDNMTDIMQMHLTNSRSVCLDRVGMFTMICRSAGNGVDTEEEVNAGQINGLKVRFSPTYTYSKFEGTTRAMFSGVTFQKLETKKTEKTEEDPNSGGGYVDPDA